jgi:5-oxoprolinase (ATP-hydrolysing)
MHPGGNGVVRELQFLADDVLASLLCERRAGFRPFGLEGGGSGELGRNTLRVKKGKDGEGGGKNPHRDSETFSEINLGGRNKVWCQRGDIIRIETPGGGAFGNVVASEWALRNYSEEFSLELHRN